VRERRDPIVGVVPTVALSDPVPLSLSPATARGSPGGASFDDVQSAAARVSEDPNNAILIEAAMRRTVPFRRERRDMGRAATN